MKANIIFKPTLAIGPVGTERTAASVLVKAIIMLVFLVF